MGPNHPLIQCVPVLFPGYRAIGGVRLTVHLNLILRLKMSGAVYFLPHTPSWCGHGQFQLILHRLETDKAYFECDVAYQ